ANGKYQSSTAESRAGAALRLCPAATEGQHPKRQHQHGRVKLQRRAIGFRAALFEGTDPERELCVGSDAEHRTRFGWKQRTDRSDYRQSGLRLGQLGY